MIVSFQGVDGWKKDADLSMDELLNSNEKNGFPPEGRVVEFGLRSIKFFRLLYCGKLWLPRSVAQQVVRHGWNMLESLNNRTYILCFNYLNMHQVL